MSCIMLINYSLLLLLLLIVIIMITNNTIIRHNIIINLQSLKKSVIPQALVEYDLRVYDKRKKEKRVPGDREKLQ